MLPKSNPVGRQLSSMPQTHRQSVLSAIANKAHAIDSRIEFLKHEGNRFQQAITQAPGTGTSRIDWIHRQLQGN